jgi:hypothetical protein
MTNRFKSSQFCGIFENIDYPDNSIQAQATFNRNVDIKGNLNIGKETSIIDASGNTIYTNTGGNINFNIEGTSYSILPSDLTKLKYTLATETFVNDSISAIPLPDLTGYATETYVDTAISAITGTDLTGYATETYVDTAISAIPPTNLTGYATETYVDTAISAIPPTDLTGYATESYVDTAISAIPPTDLTGYATESYVDTAISAIPPTDLTGYATESYVDTAISAIPPTDLTGYATETYVDTAISAIPPVDLSSYATNSSVVKLTGNQTIAGIKTFSSNPIVPDLTFISSGGTACANKNYVDDRVSTKASLSQIQNNNNVWDGTNTFTNNVSLNTASLSSNLSVNSQLVSPTQLSYLSNLTGDINTRFNANESNISTHTTQINTINDTLSGLATGSSVVNLTTNQTIEGIKTFSSSPIVPDVALGDTNLQKAVNKKYIDDKIDLLVGSASESLNTIYELGTALTANQGEITTLTNSIATKANIASPTFTGIPSAPTATQGNNSTQIATTAYVDTGLGGKANKSNETFTGTCNFENIVVSGNGSIQGQLNGTGNSVIGDSSVDTLTVNSTSTFNAPVSIATGQSLTTPEITLNGSSLNSTLSSINTNIATKTTASYVDTKVATEASSRVAGDNDVLAVANAKTTLSEVQANNNTWTGTNAFNTSLPTSTITPSSSTQLVTKTYVDTQVNTKTSLSSVQSNNNTWTGTNAFNTSLPTSTITPSSSTQLVTKTYADSLTTNLLANTNTWSGTSNTFNLALNARLIDSENGTLNNNLYSQTTTGTTTICNNQTGNLVIGKIVSEMYIGNQSTETIGIASGLAATAQVNIGQSNGSNIVNIGAFRFSGNNITLSSAFTTPTSGQIGYSVSASASAITLTSSTFVSGGLTSLSLSAGVWITNAYVHYYKSTSASGSTLTETLNAISTSPTASNGNSYIRNNYGTSTTAGFTYPTGTAQRQVNQLTRIVTVTATTTYYLTGRAIFSLVSGDSMLCDCIFNATRIA